MRKAIQGFTVIEIMIVVSIIGILSSIGIVSYINVQKNSRDQQRLSSATIITEAIEKYYDKNGDYPIYEDISNLSKAKTTLGINDDSVLFAPKADRAVSPIASEDLTGNVDVFSYYIDNPANGTWKFQYICEKNGNTVKSIASRRTPPTIAWETPVVSANSKSSSEIVLEWSPILHATSYKYRYFKKCVDTEFNSPSLGNINKNTVTSLDSGTKYCFSISGTKDTRSSPFSDKNKAVAITAPDKPTLSKPTLMEGKIKVDISGGTCIGTDLTPMYSVSSKKVGGSWSEFSEWTLINTFDSGIVPNPGDAYSFKAKARCIDAAKGIISADSTESDEKSYTHAVAEYNLTRNALIGGTVSGSSGVFEVGVNVSISATANTGYIFNKWTGHSACDNKTSSSVSFNMPSSDVACMANFTAIEVPSTPTFYVSRETISNYTFYTLDATCNGNSIPIYRYQWRIEYLDNSYYTDETGKYRPLDNTVVWAWGPETLVNTIYKETINEGMFHTLYAQAKCRIEDRGDGSPSDGPWSKTKQGFYHKPVTKPSEVTWQIHSYASDKTTVELKALGSKCSTGMILFRRYDVNSITNTWYKSATGWWRDLNGGIYISGSNNAYISTDATASTFHITSRRRSVSTGNYIEQGINTQYEVLLEQLCINTISQEQSPVSINQSGVLTITKYE